MPTNLVRIHAENCRQSSVRNYVQLWIAFNVHKFSKDSCGKFSTHFCKDSCPILTKGCDLPKFFPYAKKCYQGILNIKWKSYDMWWMHVELFKDTQSTVTKDIARIFRKEWEEYGEKACKTTITTVSTRYTRKAVDMLF